MFLYIINKKGVSYFISLVKTIKGSKYLQNILFTNPPKYIEIDFIISNGSKTKPKIYPIEVKSGKRYTTKSLERFMEKFSSRIGNGYVIHTKNLSKENNIIYIPSYMTFCL